MDKSKLPYYPQYLTELRQMLSENHNYRLNDFCIKKGISLRSFEYWLYRKQNLSMNKLRLQVSHGTVTEEGTATFSPMTIEECSGSQMMPDVNCAESVCIKMPNGVTVTLAQISESALVKTLVSLSQC